MSMRESEKIVEEISVYVRDNASLWHAGAAVLPSSPAIVTRPWSFMLRYPLSSSSAILVKVARHKGMTLAESVTENELLERTKREFEMLSSIARVFERENRNGDFSFVRPLKILPRWNALAMDELDAQPLKNYLMDARIAFGESAKWSLFEELLGRAARWLHAFHQGTGEIDEIPLAETPLFENAKNTLDELQIYLPQNTLTPVFADLQENYQELATRPVKIAMLHGDFHCGNILVSPDGRVGALDADMARGAVYRDLAKLLADLQTRSIQMLTRGKFLSEEKLARTKKCVIANYFGDEFCDTDLLALFIRLAILEKWLIDEGNLTQSKGCKSLLRKILKDWRRSYFFKLSKEGLR